MLIFVPKIDMPNSGRTDVSPSKCRGEPVCSPRIRADT